MDDLVWNLCYIWECLGSFYTGCYVPPFVRNVHLQVLLELSDAELEAGLGVTHPLHRKKLRLAIEEHRHPSHVRYPCIAQLGHTWVSSEWLPDLGLAQYSESFATNMVDARMLDHLSKKELEKLLGVTRKFHQASIVHGIHLLRMLNYDRQVSQFTLSEGHYEGKGSHAEVALHVSLHRDD